MAQALGRVVDVSALNACQEPRGRHAIEIPTAWLGAEVLVAIPSRLVCARCDGGGCDGCERRGGHRIAGDAGARSLRVRLPTSINGGAVVRIVRPFGDEAGAIAQILLETRIGSQASAGVTLCIAAVRARRPAPMTRKSNARWMLVFLFVGIALAIAIVLVARG